MATPALSARASALGPSPTLGITAQAKALKASGVDVVSFAAGEPDFNTPEPVCEAAISAIRHGFTKYTPTPGIPELRSAIADKLVRENGLHVTSEQVVVSSGAKQSLFNAMQVLLNPGDEVLLVAPYWMTYAEQVRLAGGKPVIVHSDPEGGFVPRFHDLKGAVSARTRAIVVNSPCNPTGAVWPREVLKEIAALALRHDLWIISDEIYEKLIYGVPHVSIGSLGADVAARTITINGCSKTFAMTGWRVGYAAAPVPVAKAMSNFQDQVTSCPNSFAQKGALAALSLPAGDVEGMRAEFSGRRDLIVSLLSALPGVKLEPPKGAFYVLPDFSSALGGRIKSDEELAAYLLKEFHVATIPGSVFEAKGHLRLTYAASRYDIERGIDRIREALHKFPS